MDSKLATLIGLLLSDGSVYFDRSKRTYCIQFTSKLPEMLEVFTQIMKHCFGVTSFTESKCKGAISLRVFSKEIAEQLLELSPSFRTLPCETFPRCTKIACREPCILIDGTSYPPCKIPDEIMKSEQYLTSFLRGFVSGDGSVFTSIKHKVIQISFACTHPKLRKQIKDALEILGIKSRITEDGVMIIRKESCLFFSKKVSFLPQSLVCDRKSKWFGLPKNYVLETALSSFGWT